MGLGLNASTNLGGTNSRNLVTGLMTIRSAFFFYLKSTKSLYSYSIAFLQFLSNIRQQRCYQFRSIFCIIPQSARKFRSKFFIIQDPTILKICCYINQSRSKKQILLEIYLNYFTKKIEFIGINHLYLIKVTNH